MFTGRREINDLAVKCEYCSDKTTYGNGGVSLKEVQVYFSTVPKQVREEKYETRKENGFKSPLERRVPQQKVRVQAVWGDRNLPGVRPN